MKSTGLMVLLALALGAPAYAGSPDSNPRHGGRVLKAVSGQFEIVHDASEGTLVLHAMNASGQPLGAAAAPRLTLQSKDGPIDLKLEPVAGTEGAWRASDVGLKSMELEGTLLIMVDGSTEKIDLASSIDQVDALLLFEGDRLRLKATVFPKNGRIEVRPVSREDEQALSGTAPELVVPDGKATKSIPLARDSSSTTVWSADAVPAIKTRGQLVILASLDSRPSEAKLFLSPDATKGVHGGTIVSFGTDAAPLEVLHDAEGARVCIFAIERTAQTRALEAPEALELVLTPDATATALPATAVKDVSGAWVIANAELKTKSLDGAALRAHVRGRTFEQRLAGFSQKPLLPLPQQPSASR